MHPILYSPELFLSHCISNIPYEISSDILLKLIEFPTKLEKIILLVQDEFAKKINSKPSEERYTRLSVLIQTYFNLNLDLLVPPECFEPIPKVSFN